MANLKSGIALGEDEKLVMELEAELWATSQNPIAKLIGTIKRLINLILGNKRKGFIVITDKRVIEVTQFIACWVLNAGKEVRYVIPSSVKEIGYVKEGSFLGCFCQSYYLFYESFTQRTSVLLPVTSEVEAKNIVDAFYNATKKAQ
ncbi:MAG: hypothetical protein J1F10_04385 [Muribaculaceae bacterium]|nr:hypothetical protein [Muribaculaceae bacterium]